MHHYTTFRKIFLLCILGLTFFGARGQDATISVNGTVVDEKGEPIIQAVVKIDGTQKGTVSDDKGAFTIDAPQNGFLIISHVGYDNAKIAVQSKLMISLKTSSNTLNDVVVIGYGTVAKEELTGSVAKVQEKDFQQGTISTPEQLISGKVAGVSITANGGSPGSGSTINIRGIASLNGSQSPLIIIDGLPIDQDANIAGVSNPLSTINPNDIESFTVLKDGASTAIYGSRASGGVIIITTKKGKKGKPVFTFTTNTSVSTLAKEQDVLSASAFRNYVNSSPYGKDSVNGVPFKSLLGNANTDWQKQIYRNALTTDDNFNVTGALKNLPYRISIGYLNQDGMLKTDNMKRYSGGISLTPSLLHDDLKITVNVKGSMEDTRFANGAAVSSALYFDPTQPVYSGNSAYGGYTEWITSGVLNKLAPRNPLALLELYDNTSKVYRSYGNAQFDYKMPFLPDLHANLNLGYDMSKSDGMVDVPAYAAQNYLDSGQHNPYKNTMSNTVSEFYLNYNKTIPSIKSNINATAGYGFYHYLNTNYSYYSYRANGDTIPGTKPSYYTDKPEHSLLSYYTRLIYTYNVRYILAASVREDNSSRFPNEGSSGLMPSVALTWRANKEKFLEKSKSISLLNLRLSYGVTGNQSGVPNYLYEPTYLPGGNSSLVQFGNTYYNPATLVAYNSNLKWEQTQAYNAGIDYGFLNNRISGSIEAYYKYTFNMLNYETPPAGTNVTNLLLENVGNMSNKGIEFTINATPIQTKHFSWDVSFNVAYNENKISKLAANHDTTFIGNVYSNSVQVNQVGYAPYTFLVYHQEYDQNGKPIEGVYKDVNGDGVINTKDLYYDHSALPKFIYGFSTHLTYDKWTLSTTLRANTGNYMYNSVAAASAKSNVFNSLGYLANNLTTLEATNFYYNQSLSDYYIQNASFIKMDNLTLAYNIGKIIHKKVGLVVNAFCQNVFTITKYTGIDPEIYGGYDAALYPRPRIYGLGANIQF